MTGGSLLSTVRPFSVCHTPYTIPYPPPFLCEAWRRKDSVSSSPPAPLGLRRPPPRRPPLCENRGCRRDNASPAARAAPPTTSPARPFPSARKLGTRSLWSPPPFRTVPLPPSNGVSRATRHPLPLPLRASCQWAYAHPGVTALSLCPCMCMGYAVHGGMQPGRGGCTPGVWWGDGLMQGGSGGTPLHFSKPRRGTGGVACGVGWASQRWRRRDVGMYRH